MKRLVRLSVTDINKLEQQYNHMIQHNERDFFEQGDKNFELKNHDNNDAKTFLINPQNEVEYENNQLDTMPRPGIPGPWSSSMRWIGR